MRIITPKDIRRRGCSEAQSIWKKHFKNRSVRLDTALRLAFKLKREDYVAWLIERFIHPNSNAVRIAAGNIYYNKLAKKRSRKQLEGYIHVLQELTQKHDSYYLWATFAAFAVSTQAIKQTLELIPVPGEPLPFAN